MEELLSLKWNNHRSTFLHILTILRDKQLYTDATLACDGKFYNVHRLVLSTCSDYFSAMFDRTTCKNPVIVLKDIKCEDLEALLDYMYLGEVNVRQADLASLIKAAECLRVKGLAVPDDEPPQKRGRSDTSNLRRSDGVSPPSKRKRRDEGQDGREDIRPSGGSGSSRPKTPQSHSRLSPIPSQEDVQDSKSSPSSRLQGSSDDLPQPEGDQQNPFVKVEMEDTGGEDLGSSGDTFNISADGYKEEPENDAGDPGGDLSNDLPEFLQQASGSHLGTGSGASFGPDSYPPSSSFQSGDLGWQGEGSNLNYPGHLNYSSSTETSSQNAPGARLNFGGDGETSSRGGRVDSVDGSIWPSESGTASLSSSGAATAKLNSHLECPVCKKKFSGRNRKQNLHNHFLIHTGNKNYFCPFCSYTALHKWHLKGHLLRRHAEAFSGTNLLS